LGSTLSNIELRHIKNLTRLPISRALCRPMIQRIKLKRKTLENLVKDDKAA
jgi:hypothetical protein